MAITQVGSVTTASTTGATLTVTKPTGVASGDVLTAVVAAVASTSSTSTAPSGWTKFASQNTSHTAEQWYKVAGGSEPSSYDWVTSSAFARIGSITAWRGVDNTTPIGTLHTEAQTAAGVSEPRTGRTLDVTPETRGRLFYVRTIRATNTTASFTLGSSGVSQINAPSNTGGGEVIAAGWWVDDADFTTTGSKTGVISTCSITETSNYESTYALKSATVPATGTFAMTLSNATGAFTGSGPADGAISATLGNVTSSFTATSTGGSFSAPLGSVTGSFSGTLIHGSFAAPLGSVTATITGQLIHGSFAMSAPSVTGSMSGAIAAFGSFSATLPHVTAEVTAETSPFGPRVIHIANQRRAVRIEAYKMTAIYSSQVTQE